MKSTVFVVTLSALAAADSGLPTCATTCISQFTSGSSIAGCGQDIKCICSNESFLSETACCLIQSCSSSDQEQALSYAKSICTAGGVQVPNHVTCNVPSSSSPGSSTSTSSSSASTINASSGNSTVSTTAGPTTAGPTTAAASSFIPTSGAGRVMDSIFVRIIGSLINAAM